MGTKNTSAVVTPASLDGSDSLEQLRVSAKSVPLNQQVLPVQNKDPVYPEVKLDVSGLLPEQLSKILAAQLDKSGKGLGLLSLTPDQFQQATGIPYWKTTVEAVFKKNGIELRNPDGSSRTVEALLSDMVKRDGEPALYKQIPKPILDLLGGAAIAYDLATTGGKSVKSLGLSYKVLELKDSANSNNSFKVSLVASPVGLPIAAGVEASVGTSSAPFRGSAPKPKPGEPPLDSFYAVAKAQINVNDRLLAGKFTVVTGLGDVSLALSATVNPNPSKNQYAATVELGKTVKVEGSINPAGKAALSATFAIDPNQKVKATVADGGAQVSYTNYF